MRKNYCKISEGLGNQLFMYNAYALSKKNNFKFIDPYSGYYQKVHL